jgi:hypothetical protein
MSQLPEAHANARVLAIGRQPRLVVCTLTRVVSRLQPILSEKPKKNHFFLVFGQKKRTLFSSFGVVLFRRVKKIKQQHGVARLPRSVSMFFAMGSCARRIRGSSNPSLEYLRKSFGKFGRTLTLVRKQSRNMFCGVCIFLSAIQRRQPCVEQQASKLARQCGNGRKGLLGN